MDNKSVCSLAIEEGLISNEMLFNWIKEYKENCYNIVEQKQGRPTMQK